MQLPPLVHMPKQIFSSGLADEDCFLPHQGAGNPPGGVAYDMEPDSYRADKNFDQSLQWNERSVISSA